MAKQNQKQKYRRQRAGDDGVDKTTTPSTSIFSSIISSIGSIFTEKKDDPVKEEKDDPDVDTDETKVDTDETTVDPMVETTVGSQDGGKKHKKSSKKSKSKKSRAKKHKKSVKR